jgi:hypothetical protein
MSYGFSATARTRTSTSSSLGAGFAPSSSRNTSGPPYSRYVMAFIGFFGAAVRRSSQSLSDIRQAMTSATTAGRRW